MPKGILATLRQEIQQYVDHKYKAGSINFFKEPIVCYGVRTPTVRKIANKFWEKINPTPSYGVLNPAGRCGIKNLNKNEIFKLCEELLKSDYCEDATIAFAWARKIHKQFTKNDFIVFERWLKKYINNWAKCDDFCTHTFGTLIKMYPDLIPKTKTWRKSKNRWLRRASAVIFITSSNTYETNPKHLKDIFETADTLLTDPDDLVQKGYGWMLKAASHYNPKEVFNFVMKRKDIMPRTALRYAIEKYPQEMRLRAMKKI